jgi:CRP-like cAMP-binding protein
MTDTLQLIQETPLFAVLEQRQQAEIARLAGRRELRKGELLCMHGDPWPYLLLVVSGGLDAVKLSGEGRSLLVGSFGAGEFFWGLAFFEDQAPNPVSLQARSRAQVLLWRREECQPFLLRNGALTWEIARLMSRRMLRASEMLEGLAFQPVANRLARLLLEQYPEQHGAGERHLTLDEMAARVGSTREMVCRILYRFADQGAIEINRTEFVFKDRSLLQDYK